MLSTGENKLGSTPRRPNFYCSQKDTANLVIGSYDWEDKNLLSGEAKYFGVILDFKLSWKKNEEERMKDEKNDFYGCRTLFGRK